MGIQGLLPQLKSIMAPIHVEELRGQTVAVDTYSWLHKGALSCSAQLCKGLPTSKHIDYCMHRVNLLRHHGVKPILVFDGGLLPMKLDQETKRSRARKENLERAMEHEVSGNSAAAYDCYQKAVDISPSIASKLINVLKQEKVAYIVAPYEADAQMTFLAVNKFVDAVITEDSDLIPFGCSRIIFKMDKFGQGVEFQSSRLGQNKDLDFTGFTKQMVLEMCILSGCDYQPSLPGMGLKRAHALVQKLKTYEKVIKHLRYSNICVPPLYEETFKKAMWAFKHQRVYDHTKEDIVHLSEIPDGVDQDLDFLGPWIPQNVAKEIAEGDLDPITNMLFQAKKTCSELSFDKSYSAKDFTAANGRKKLDLPVQKNLLTNYFCLASIEAKRKFRAAKVMPEQMPLMDLSSPSSENPESGSPASVEEPPTQITNQPIISLIVAKRKFRAPKIIPKQVAMSDSFSPSSEIHESDSPASAEELTPEDSMKSRFSDKIKKLNGSSVHGNLYNSQQRLESRHESLKPFLTSHKEVDCNLARYHPENITNSSNNKAIVRSSYFQHKLVDENHQENQNCEPSFGKDDISGALSDYLVSKDASLGNNCLKSPIKKRKLIHVHAAQREDISLKEVEETSVLEEEGQVAISSRKEDTDGFGCNISHLNNYSGIAEKSMEKFVSLISSFRYNSSGSRASGLRAPLKEVQNTCTVRSGIAVTDLNKYRYTAEKKKATL